MSRFFPKSLVGQIAIVMALALLIAQVINFNLILSERQRASVAQAQAPALSRFVLFAQRIASMAPEERRFHMEGMPRWARMSLDAQSLVQGEQSERRLENRMREAAALHGVLLLEVRGMIRPAEVMEPVTHRAINGQFQQHRKEFQIMILSARLPNGQWLNARMAVPRSDPWLIARLAAATLLLYLIVLGAMIWMARRLASPLRDLTAAAEGFKGRGEAVPVSPRGPDDIRQAIVAFNAMSARVSAMLDEKDRMLAAIGHDLRTPLAALRIRAETAGTVEQSRRMIATIEEMTSILDDTLALARSGRTREPVRPLDVTALADAVVEEFRSLGHDVEMVESERTVAEVRPDLLRRAIRNLVENALKYAGSAKVRVQSAGDNLEIIILDSGPGIAEDEIDNVLEPFYRLESSRSRETGGSGIGLTLARAAALAHGGELSLENRPEGGLSARILLPSGKKG